MTLSSPGRASAASDRDIWSLTWPQMLMMAFNFLIGLADVYAAGQIGTEAQAAMGVMSQCLMFFVILAMAVANGSVAAIGQSLGAGRDLRAARYAGLCLACGLALGIGFTLAVYPGRHDLMFLLRVPPGVEGNCLTLLDIFLPLLPLYYLLLIANAVLRAYKLVMLPLWSMCLATIVNALGDFGLGLGYFGLPRLGLTGIAYSTFLSITLALCASLVFMLRLGLLSVRVMPPGRWSAAAIGYVLKVAWPSGLMQIVWQSGYLVLFAIAAALPMGSVDALAGMTAGLRIESALFLPGMAFNLTAAILIGHTLGASRPDEAKRLGYRILFLGAGGVSLLSLGFWPFLEQVAAALVPDPAASAQAVSYLRYNLAAIPFTMTSMILAGALNGAGATRYNLIVFAVSIWGLRLPLAYLLGHVLAREASGIWASMLVSQAAQSLILIYVFQKKNWARFALAARPERGRATAPAKG